MLWSTIRFLIGSELMKRLPERLFARFCPIWPCLLLLSSTLPLVRAANSTNDIVGAISVPGERDVYSFSAPTAGLYYLDVLTNVSLAWTLENASRVVANRNFNTSDGWFAAAPVLALEE